MSYKPTEQDLIAYLFDELEGEERLKVEQYLLENPQAQKELEGMANVRSALRTVKDKEVIAPPLFLDSPSRSHFWDTPYFKTIASIAASLIIIILVGRLSGLSVEMADNQVTIAFGERKSAAQPDDAVSPQDVQRMINESLQANNSVLTKNWDENQEKLARSIGANLVVNSDKMNKLVVQASTASKDEIREYVSSLQAENMKLVKDYFTLTSGQQKEYIESMLVDFAKYLQQQRQDDMQLVQMRLNNIEENTTVFKQETEHILTSIISTVGRPVSNETKY